MTVERNEHGIREQVQAARGESQVANDLELTIEETERRSRSATGVADILAARYGVHPSSVWEMLRSVWTVSEGKPPLTVPEMFSGAQIAAVHRLNPFTREIYVSRDKRDRLMTIIGIDGWIRIVTKTDGYDGFEQDCVVDNKGNLISVETRIYSKHYSRPARYVAEMKEWLPKGGFMWDKGGLKNHMLKILSYRHAARYFSPISSSAVLPEETELFDLEAVESSRANTSVEPESAGTKTQRTAEELNRRRNSASQASAREDKPNGAASSPPEQTRPAEANPGPADRSSSSSDSATVQDWVDSICKSTTRERLNQLSRAIEGANFSTENRTRLSAIIQERRRELCIKWIGESESFEDMETCSDLITLMTQESEIGSETGEELRRILNQRAAELDTGGDVAAPESNEKTGDEIPPEKKQGGTLY